MKRVIVRTKVGREQWRVRVEGKTLRGAFGCLSDRSLQLERVMAARLVAGLMLNSMFGKMGA